MRAVALHQGPAVRLSREHARVPRLGRDQFTGLGRQQLGHLYGDPRVEPEFVIGAWPDAWHAFEDAERALVVAELGAHELMGQVVREAVKLGLHVPSGIEIEAVEMTHEQVAALRPYYARREMARISIQREFPEQRAFTLVAMFSALDAFVESVGDAFLRLRADGSQGPTDSGPTTVELVKKARKLLTESVEAGRIPSDAAKALRTQIDAIHSGPKGLGVDRWDRVLRHVRMGNRDRVIPENLEQALREIGAIRHSIIHRHGRADRKLLEDAPTLSTRYSFGDLLRITRTDYKVYSAALFTMLDDFDHRIRMSAGASPDKFPLDTWVERGTFGV